MKDKINIEVLSILKKNDSTNKIELEFIPIKNLLEDEMETLKSFCDSKTITLTQLVEFISKTSIFNLLSKGYKYCVNLNGTFQSFIVDNHATILEILTMRQIMRKKKFDKPETYNMEDETFAYKQKIKDKYILWQKAYSIAETYNLCRKNKSIITFSHRKDGWSNPIYHLSKNLTVEIKTNFGFGNSSYFYSIIRYKDIEITPFSEWVYYEFAKFSEIIRYTQTYLLQNEDWLSAMEFSRDACNLSIESEELFIEKYILFECEQMVIGLENILKENNFTFKHRRNENYRSEKKGHILIEFRGEKISGSLNFIKKIIEFENIITIKKFIDRIENCCKIIQPILLKEIEILKPKVNNLSNEISVLKPAYEAIVEQKNQYEKKKNDLLQQMLIAGILNTKLIDLEILENNFSEKYPLYKEFLKMYVQITNEYIVLTKKLENLTNTFNNILSYNEKILSYFK